MKHITENELEVFRVWYDSIKVSVFDDYLHYDFHFFFNARKEASLANKLIEVLGLNLVAIHSGKNSFFIVKSLDIPDL